MTNKIDNFVKVAFGIGLICFGLSFIITTFLKNDTVKINSPNKQYTLELSTNDGKNGILFLDNNAKLKYIDEDGNIYRMEVEKIKDDKVVKPEVKPEPKIGDSGI